PQQLGDFAARELRVDEHAVTGSGRVLVLRPVHTPGSRLDPLRKPKGHEVVNRRRPNTGALRWIHPIREMEDVERPNDRLDRGAADPAPRASPNLGSWQERQPQLHG